MEQTEKKGLFDMTISDSSRDFIRKFATVARIGILLSIIISLINIVIIFIHAVKIDPAIYGSNTLLLFQHNIMPYYGIISFTIICILLYFYWQVTRHLERGLDQDDPVVFNGSFELLYRYSVYSLIGSALSLLLHFLDFYVVLRRHVY